MRVVVEPYRGGSPVTPNDTTTLSPTRGLFIGGTGNISVDFVDGTSALITAPTVGKIIPISVVKVKATGTTATAIVALY